MVAANEIYEMSAADFVGPVRVKFGPGKTQDLPQEWAEIMLTELHSAHGALFGKLLTKAAAEAK
jgi:hypothetical protein